MLGKPRMELTSEGLPSGAPTFSPQFAESWGEWTSPRLCPPERAGPALLLAALSSPYFP